MKHLFFNAFLKAGRLRDKMGQRFAVLAPEVPDCVTMDLNNDVMRLRSTSGTFPLLKLVKNY